MGARWAGAGALRERLSVSSSTSHERAAITPMLPSKLRIIRERNLTMRISNRWVGADTFAEGKISFAGRA